MGDEAGDEAGGGGGHLSYNHIGLSVQYDGRDCCSAPAV